MGSVLQLYNDFMNVTGPSYVTGADEVVIEAVKRTYLLKRFLRGRGREEVLQGGNRIKDVIIFDEATTFQFYNPNATFNWVNPQVTQEHSIDWRCAVDHMSWTKHEVVLNLGGGLDRAHRTVAFKRLKRIKEARMWTSLINGLENALTAVPNKQLMEVNGTPGSTPGVANSIFAFVNEDYLGLYGEGPAAGTGDDSIVTGGVYTEVMGLSPATYARWAPQTEQYDTVELPAGGDVVPNNIITAFDNMWLKVKFETPPTRQEYFEDPSLNAMVIITSRKGSTLFQGLVRSSQNLFQNRQDPGATKPVYGGIDIEYIENLDTAPVYHGGNGAARVTEGSSSAIDRGARFYWIHGRYLLPVFNTEVYMDKGEVMRHPNQPFTYVQTVDTWYNLFCRSRQRMGVVYPDGSVSGAY